MVNNHYVEWNSDNNVLCNIIQFARILTFLMQMNYGLKILKIKILIEKCSVMFTLLII